MPRMRHHARPQALPHLRQNAKQQTIHDNNDGRSPALIDMPRAERGRREQNPRRHIAGPRAELSLEISTENNLFANARRDGRENPKKNLQLILREQEANVLASVGRVQRDCSAKQDCKGDEPKTRGDGDIL